MSTVFVYLLAGLRKQLQTDFHRNLVEVWASGQGETQNADKWNIVPQE